MKMILYIIYAVYGYSQTKQFKKALKYRISLPEKKNGQSDFIFLMFFDRLALNRTSFITKEYITKGGTKDDKNGSGGSCS
jgi:hypothetical protein